MIESFEQNSTANRNCIKIQAALFPRNIGRLRHGVSEDFKYSNRGSFYMKSILRQKLERGSLMWDSRFPFWELALVKYWLLTAHW